MILGLLLTQEGTTRLIYAINPNDPPSNNVPLNKHTVKGVKSVLLLSPQVQEPTLPSDAFSVDFVMSGVSSTKKFGRACFDFSFKFL